VLTSDSLVLERADDRRYGQTKFLLTAWAAAVANAHPWLDVVTHSPGPIFTDMGKEHVPLILLPT